MAWADYRLPYKAKRRCLVPASGFYEWEARPDGKQPFFFTRPKGACSPMQVCGDEWRQPDGGTLLSYTIVTTSPNDFVKRFHDRMPSCSTRTITERGCRRTIREGS
jgi:putative SOS response-associated peptidase YedK